LISIFLVRLIQLCSIALLLFGITTSVSARDIPRTDPERKVILDAVRSSPDIRYVVKDLYRSGDFAWLCALETENGEARRTDEAIEVNAYVLLRDKGAWVSNKFWTGFLGHEGTDDCSSAVEQFYDLEGVPPAEDDIKAVWKFVIQERLMSDIKWGYWGKGLIESGHRGKGPEGGFGGLKLTMAMLKEHGLQEDFVIDHPATPFTQVGFDAVIARCKDAGCKKTMAQAAADLTRLQGGNRVSSLVWDNCRFGGMNVVANCVDTHMLKLYCRPGMHYFLNKDDIQHCLGDIAQQCRSLPFRDEGARALAACFMFK